MKVLRDEPAEMRDGTILRSDIYRPSGKGPFPVLLQRTPYDKRRAKTVKECEELTAAGYIVAAQDIRGRYASDGDFQPFYLDSAPQIDRLDGYDTIQWASELPDATGRVGTFGVSYASWTQWQLATVRPPQLSTMFTGGMCVDSRSTWPGIFTRDRQLQWAINTLAPDTRSRHGIPGPKSTDTAERAWELEKGKWLWFEPMSEIPSYVLGKLSDQLNCWLSRHNVDWFQFAREHREIDVPIMHLTGWYDRLIGTIDHFNGMKFNGRSEKSRQNQKLVIGPWTHGFELSRIVGNVDFGPQAEIRCTDLMARWFDYWLKGIDTGVLEDPPVRIFVMGSNEWRDEDQWPLPRVHYTKFYLHSQGRANSTFGDGILDTRVPDDEPSDSYVYDPRDPLMSVYLTGAQLGPGDLSFQNHRSDMLVYQTQALETEVEVTGPIFVRVHAATSAPDTDWTARLVDVDQSGNAVNLCSGIQRARYRRSWESPTLLEPGRVYEYTIELNPTSNLFRAGHRIRLDVSSSDFPNFDRNHNYGLNDWEDSRMQKAQQRVFHDHRYPSHIELPIVE